MAQLVKNPPAKAGDARDLGSIPGLGGSPGEGNGNHSSILAWKIPQTEEPGGLQSMKSQRVGQDRVCTHTHAHIPINESPKNDKNVWYI